MSCLCFEVSLSLVILTNIEISVEGIYLSPLLILFLSFYARWTERWFTRAPFALFCGVLDAISNRPWKLEEGSWNRRFFETARVSIQDIGDFLAIVSPY